MPKMGDFFVELGTKIDSYSLKDFANTLGNLPFSAGAAITAIAGIEIGFLALTSHALEGANSLNMFTAETGISAETLGRWENAAKQAGVTAETVKGSFTGLQSAVYAGAHGAQGVLLGFSNLGIGDWQKASTPQLMMEIRKKLMSINPKNEHDMSKFRAAIAAVGVSADMMPLLGNKHFDSMMAAGPTFSNGDLNAMADLTRELARFSTNVEKHFVHFLTQAGPSIDKLATVLGKFVDVVGPVVVKSSLPVLKEADKDLSALLDKDKRKDIKLLASLAAHNLTEGPNLIESLSWLELLSHHVLDLTKGGPGPASVSVTQNIHGVTNAADIDHIGAMHLKHAAKRMNRGY